MIPQFLYPTKRQFPFDEVCEQIVRALAARAFTIPGFVVEVADYGSGAQKLRHVSSIKSDQSAIDLGSHDVVIKFGRTQGILPGGRWNDCAAVSEIQLPKRLLHVYEDESGPTYDVYVGDDWERDRWRWWTRPNAQLNNAPRLCVQYSGAYPRYRGQRPSKLAAVNDRREYGPQGKDPKEFDTAKVMEEFRTYLQSTVLPRIEAYPVVLAKPDAVAPPIAMPTGMEVFFAYGDGRDARRIEIGKKKIEDLSPPDRYGLAGSGWRLAPLGIKSGDDLPEVAYEGFLWCGTSPMVPGEHSFSSQDVLIKVSPKDARGIYVADHATYEKRRSELAAAIKGQRGSFTDAEVNDFIRARACTIVPIVDYKGGYEDPVYLINRELSFDEVEVIGRRPER